MDYRRLGRSGLKVSALSFGSWVSFGNQLDAKAARECLAAARDAGVNFFDNAEAYASGHSETLMGEAFRALKWPRLSYVVSTKFYWGLSTGPNQDHTLNRKYLLESIDGSLQRFGLDHVDLVYCHRPDPNTPVEETVWAMHDIIACGKALYWGTSEWPAGDIRAAWDIAQRHHLHKPVAEEPEYNLFHRRRVEVEYARLYQDTGLGLTTWSPLASGLLTGKYASGTVPDGSRAALKNYDWLRQQVTDLHRNQAVSELGRIAAELGATTAQLALAWCLSKPHVSSVITGASRPAQVIENMQAVDVAARLDPEMLARIEALTEPLAD